MSYKGLFATGLVALALGAGAALAESAPPAAAALDTQAIERIVGVKGKFNAGEGVYKVSVPRNDLKVTAAGVRLTPPMGLTSWAAFQQAGDHAMVMGDMVVLEDQVFPVMKAALAAGLEVTALHNHFFWDSPKVMFMHISGMGAVDGLAGGVAKVFKAIQASSGGKGRVPTAAIDPARTSLDPKKIAAVLGHQGELTKGVYKVTIGRATKMADHQVGKDMGVNTWPAFVGSDARAAVAGDFVVFEPELQPVLKALTGAGIQVVAIHHHMTGESPRTVFLHYWGVGPTAELARGLKTALDTMKE